MVINLKKIIILFTIVTAVLGETSLLRGQKQVFLKVQVQGFQPIIISVPFFKSENNLSLADELRTIVINDLINSGFFRVVEQAHDEQKNDVVYVPLSISDAGGQLVCELNDGKNTIELLAHLKELPSGQSVFTKKLQASSNKKRWLAHQLSNHVVYYLTGEHGINNTKIAFVKNSRGNKELAVIDYDGFGEQLITANNSLNLSPGWSADAEKLAYTSYAAGNPDMYVLDLDNKNETKISKLPFLHSAPNWSPNGKRIALTIAINGNSDIYIMDPGSGKIQKLTTSPAIDSSPSFSPDGRFIAFTSDRSGSPQIYIMNNDGTDTHRLTYEGKYNDSAAWSPKGDRIAYVSRTESGFQIFSIDINGEDLKQITNSGGNNENPSWSPDGTKLVFASNRSGQWQLYVTHQNGDLTRQLTKSGENYMPKWSPLIN